MTQKKDISFPTPGNYTFKFIDLFAGIGGFRIALQNLGGKCVFTSEWDKDAQKTYKNNFGEQPFGDITLPETKNEIPDNFDVLCAGFPCQPFSKGGFQNGFEDTRGTLFFDICQIVEKHKPKYIFLENVANVVSHDQGNTYKTILKHLDELGYYFPNEPLIISPDKFGIPILRPRVYIPCVRKDLAKGNASKIKNIEGELEKQYTKDIDSIDTVLDNTSKNKITSYELKILKMWNEFYRGIDLKVIGFPIWMEFFKYDKNLDNFPLWKAKFIQKNIDLYNRNKKHIDKWLKKYDNLDWCVKTHRKMEWQAGKDYESIFECIIQFRPSGVRVKRPNKFSTLVAMNHQQIIGKYKRRLTIDESKRLQSFPENYKLPKSNTIAMKQLGNSVNVTVVQKIFEVVLKEFS
ncbi:MAG: DNA (cytosine-5-)-methyltransferase [Lutibacter sp.]|nr:MAG: DNA (cytosine-5-)-methyltransferase [Lutibacter sp.]